jgi:hypothetical protein
MRTFSSFLAVGILAATVGCGGSSGNGTSSTGRSASNGGQCPVDSTCTGEAEYENCLLTACGAEYKACFGANFASGDFTGSPCADFIKCEMACPCDATGQACEANCATQYAAMGSACYTAITALATCVGANVTPNGSCVPPVCSGGPTGTSTSTDTSTSTGCAEALACCTSLGATYGAAVAQQCAAALSGQTDAVCAQLVASYRQAGVCP